MTKATIEKKERVTKQRQQQIRDAALQVFAQKGFAHATTAEIARTAGVSEGTIYNYYKDKHDLLISIIRTYIDTELFTHLAQESRSTKDSAAISTLIEDRLNLGFTNVDAMFLLMNEIQLDADLRRQYVEEVARPILKELEEYIERKVSSGEFRALNAAVAARALIAMIMGLSIIYKVEGPKGPLSRAARKTVVSETAGLVLQGMQK
jgi:AcrR family transcriptional regulator